MTGPNGVVVRKSSIRKLPIGSRSRQYGPSAARSVQKRPSANIPQYGPEQVKLVSSLLYGIIFRTKQHFR